MPNPAAFNFGPGDNPCVSRHLRGCRAVHGSFDGGRRSARSQARPKPRLTFQVASTTPCPTTLTASASSTIRSSPYTGFVREGMRVAYVDIDCHHGDGVQHAFYSTDRVMTISRARVRRILVPRHRIRPGDRRRRGPRLLSQRSRSIPYTSDEVYLWAFRETVVPLLNCFQAGRASNPTRE